MAFSASVSQAASLEGPAVERQNHELLKKADFGITWTQSWAYHTCVTSAEFFQFPKLQIFICKVDIYMLSTSQSCCEGKMR